jgi:hypothetical protein
MPANSRRRTAIWMVVASVTATAGAVALNFATGWVRNPWAWASVAALTILSAAVSLHLARVSEPRPEPETIGGNVSGVVNGNTFYGDAYVLGVGAQILEVEGNPKK